MEIKIEDIYNNSIATNTVFKGMVVEKFIKNQIIFNLGDIGDKYYIILKGKLMISLKISSKLSLSIYDIKLDICL